MPTYARRIVRLTNALQVVGFALGGEAGSRLATQLHMSTSADTLLRLIRQTNVSPINNSRVVGVDDWPALRWVFRKGSRYGTILLDLEKHQPSDLLPDRSTEYAKGATYGSPLALQVAG